MIAISTYATRSFLYALDDQAALVVAAWRYADSPAAQYILVTDMSDEAVSAAKRLREILPFRMWHLPLDVDENATGTHEQSSNVVIAAMQHEALSKARFIGADFLWSVEADILPNANTLQSLTDALRFDRGWYDVAMAGYPNHSFLGGYGTMQNQIAPNVYPNERKVSVDLAKRLKSKDLATRNKAQEDAKNCAPNGNIFERQAKGWKPRGWLEEAYPGVGRGAILPTSWFGMGCTLFSRKAMDLSNWTGYQGAGTQDLWLGWRCLHQHGLRFAVVPHALCSHLKRINGKMTLLHSYHETQGDSAGHLRCSKIDQSENPT
jgi:hypothetical protein